LLELLMLYLRMIRTRLRLPTTIREPRIRTVLALVVAAVVLSIGCGSSSDGDKSGGSGENGGGVDVFGDGGCNSSDNLPASAISSRFLSSSTDTSTIGIGDKIKLEVSITLNRDENYNTVFWSLSGDVNGVEDVRTAEDGWPGVANNVTNWEWNYLPRTKLVLPSTDTAVEPAEYRRPIPAPGVVGLGFFGQNRTGTGIPSVVGTVTIRANTLGEFEGGAFCIPGLDGLFGSSGEDETAKYNTAVFTVTDD
jgi:hypothetical protein